MTDWSQVLIEIGAVFAGVFLAFLLDRAWDSIAAGRESVRVLALIRNELLANVGTLERIDALFKNNETQQLPYYRLHSDVWEAVSSKIEIVKNDELLTKITEEYFTFDMFERTLQLYEDMCLSVSGH